MQIENLNKTQSLAFVWIAMAALIYPAVNAQPRRRVRRPQNTARTARRIPRKKAPLKTPVKDAEPISSRGIAPQTTPENQRAAQSKQDGFERFGRWLQSKGTATSEDVRALWDYASQKARGIKPTLAAHEKALKRAAKVGIALSLIVAFVYASIRTVEHALELGHEQIKAQAGILESIRSLIAAKRLSKDEAFEILIRALDHRPNEEVVSVILDSGLLSVSDLNTKKSHEGYIALAHAVGCTGSGSKLESIRKLLDYGINPNAPIAERSSRTISDCFYGSSTLDALKLLIERGARFSLPQKKAFFIIAIEKDRPDIATFLMPSIDINENITYAFQSLSYLSIAARNGKKNMIEFLLRNGATPTDDPLVQSVLHEFAMEESRLREVGVIPSHQRRTGLGLGVRGRRRRAIPKPTSQDKVDSGAGVG